MSTTTAAATALSRARAPFEAAVERARLTVVPRARRRVRAPRMPFVTLVSVVLVGGIVGLLCFNTQMQQASFAATTLEERASNLSAREQTLRTELEALRDPQHVAVLAAQAGMVAPRSACTLRLGAGPASGDCTAAAGGPSTPNPLPPAPEKPAVLDPEPVVVTVRASGSGQGDGKQGDGKPDKTKPDKTQNQPTRDTGRG
jgi:hypothetical protein